MSCWDCIEDSAMKFVYGYQKMRHSPFMAQRFENAGCVESIGEFFLTPAHYLFVGRTVTYVKENDTYTEKQTYDYIKYFWLKTVAAIIALPISLILGSIFKGLSLLSGSVQHRNADFTAKQLTLEDHKKEYDSIGATFSEEFAPCMNKPRPTFEELEKTDPARVAKHRILLKALEDIEGVLKPCSIPNWLDYGTALGAYRHGYVIPWDHDIDISILKIDFQNVKNILKHKLDPEKYEVFDSSGLDKPNTYLRVYIKEDGSYIDIYTYDIDPDEKTVTYIASQENSCLIPEYMQKRDICCVKPIKADVLFPLRKAKFHDMTLCVPNDVVAYLQRMYGEDLSPAKVWNSATQTYDRVEGHPYWKQSDL